MNQFYVEPMNIMPGVMALTTGIKERMNKKAEASRLQKINDLFKRNDPDELSAFASKSPENMKMVSETIKLTNDMDRQQALSIAKRGLIELDGDVQTPLIEAAEKKLESGEDATSEIKDAIKAQKDPEAFRKGYETILSLYDKDAWNSYKEMKYGPEKKAAQVSGDYAAYQEDVKAGNFKGSYVDWKKAMRPDQKAQPDVWDDWGYGKKRNRRTGEIKSVPVKPESKASGSLDDGDLDTLAGMVARNEIDVSQLSKRKDFNQIIAKAKKLNPGLNLRFSSAEFMLSKNPTFRQRAIVAEAVDDLLENVVAAGKKLNYNKIKAVGSFQKFVREQTNDPELVEYMAMRNDSLMELASVMRGMGMTDQAHRAENEAASPTMSPQALDAWMRAQKKALKPRIERYRGIIKNPETKQPIIKTDQKNKPMVKMPDAIQNKGRVIRDTDTGKRYKSNGSTWTEVK